jgi:hypothetical protein
LKKDDDFKKRKIFWKNISENFPYGKIFHLTSLTIMTELPRHLKWMHYMMDENNDKWMT